MVESMAGNWGDWGNPVPVRHTLRTAGGVTCENAHVLRRTQCDNAICQSVSQRNHVWTTIWLESDDKSPEIACPKP